MSGGSGSGSRETEFGIVTSFRGHGQMAATGTKAVSISSGDGSSRDVGFVTSSNR
jgi:hypothetical protein